MQEIKKFFKTSSFVILLVVASTTILATIGQGFFGILSVIGQNNSLITDKIYALNCFLCVISIFFAITYLILKVSYNSDDFFEKRKKIKKKFDIKSFLKRTWPCAVLVIFMLWTAVGCIQASMEAAAEAALKDNISTNDTERNKEIAAWSETDRMPNAADRSWNGCNNLKDGYFSFLFYMMVALNVVILGEDSEKQKKIILRTLLISSIILGVFAIINFFNTTILGGIVKYNRAIFNNSNHYGYFLSITTILAMMMALKEKGGFRITAIVAFVLLSYILIINNTFGAYLGVITSLIFIALCLVFKFIKNRNVVEEKKDSIVNLGIFTILTIVFLFFTFTISNINVTPIVSNGKILNVSTLSFNFVGNTYNLKYNKNDGLSFEKAKNNIDSIVETNFKQLMKDATIIFDYFKSDSQTDEDKKDNTVLNDLQKAEENQNSNSTLDNTNETNNKSGLTDEVSNTGSGRGEVWIKSLDLIKQRLIFGWGLENLLNEFYYQYNINEGRTHNLILQLAGTTGIPGMLLYMVGVIAIFFKVLFNYKNWGYIEYISMPIFISYMVSSMFGNSGFYTSPYFMIILGMMMASMIFNSKSKNSEEVYAEEGNAHKSYIKATTEKINKKEEKHKEEKIKNEKQKDENKKENPSELNRATVENKNNSYKNNNYKKSNYKKK